jgi:hypothetical protein
MAAFNEPLTDAEYDRVALMLARSERAPTRNPSMPSGASS